MPKSTDKPTKHTIRKGFRYAKTVKIEKEQIKK